MDNNTALVSMATLGLRLGIDEAFQLWGGGVMDGIVGDQNLIGFAAAASATLETEVGLNFVIG